MTHCESNAWLHWIVIQNFLCSFAFIYHSSSWHARRNLRRQSRVLPFGPNCRVRYARQCSVTDDDDDQSVAGKIISVRQIPVNVNKKELKNLFRGCHLLKYCPVRTIPSTVTRSGRIKPEKVLKGYGSRTIS